MRKTSFRIYDKIGYLKDFLAEKLMNEPKRVPNEVVIEVTGKCNLNCYFCFNKLYIKKRSLIDDLPYSVIIKIIDNISGSPIKRIRFTGGEPMIRKDIFRLLKHANSKGLRVWLNTNATLIKKKEAKIISKYVENVLVSLNSYNSKDERALTGKDLFDKKIRGIKYLKLAGLKKVRVGTVATKKNIKNLEAFHNIVKKLDIDDWELFRPIPINKVNITYKDIKLLIEKLTIINKANNSNYLIRNALPICSYNPKKVDAVSEGAYSDDGHSRIIVDFRGFLKPMYYIYENVGYPTDNILKVWNSSFMKNIRQLRYVPELCKRCKYLEKCKGGSRITAKLIKGSYNEVDYLAQPEKYSNFLF